MPNSNLTPAKSLPNSLTETLKELSIEIPDREYITPISDADRIQVCTCGHIKKYHILDSTGVLKCKYESCSVSCKGYKLSEKQSRRVANRLALKPLTKE